MLDLRRTRARSVFRRAGHFFPFCDRVDARGRAYRAVAFLRGRVISFTGHGVSFIAPEIFLACGIMHKVGFVVFLNECGRG